MFLIYPFVYTQIKVWSPLTVTYNWVKDSVVVMESRSGTWVAYEHEERNLKIKLHLLSSGGDHEFSVDNIQKAK